MAACKYMGCGADTEAGIEIPKRFGGNGYGSTYLCAEHMAYVEDCMSDGVMMRSEGAEWNQVHPKAIRDMFPREARKRGVRRPTPASVQDPRVRDLETAVRSMWSVLCAGDRERMRGVVRSAGVSVA